VLRLEDRAQDEATIVVPVGLLCPGTYSQLRDYLIKVSADNPRAVVVDLTDLGIESDAALAIFLAVQTRLQQWPGVPLLLVTGPGATRNMVARNRTGHFMPVHDSVVAAIAAIDEPPPRRVERLRLPNELASPRVAREFTRMTCRQWHCTTVIDEAALLVGELVTNTVMHTLSSPEVHLELRRDLFSIAVYDDVPGEVSLLDPGTGGGLHGLLLVAQISTAWGCSPTSSGGKVVWATLRLF
jgi:anti-anti-sigma regulatory factor